MYVSTIILVLPAHNFYYRTTTNRSTNTEDGNQVMKAAEETARVVLDLRAQIQVLQREKLALERHTANNTSYLSNESFLCQTCIDKSTAEVVYDVARSTQEVRCSSF